MFRAKADSAITGSFSRSVNNVPDTVSNKYFKSKEATVYIFFVKNRQVNAHTQSEQIIVSCSDGIGSFFACSHCVSRAAGFFDSGCYVSLSNGKQFKIRQEKLIGQGTLTAIKSGTGGLDAKTIARLCEVPDCQPGDLMEYVKE